MADPYDGRPAESSLEPKPEQKPAPAPAMLTPQTDVIPLEDGLPAPRTLEEMYRVARLFCQSQIVPEEYQAGYKDQPEKVAVQKIMVATFMGRELGLSMLAALRSIAVIKGRPSVWGDAIPALAERTGKIQWVKERLEGSGDALTATCEIKRTDWPHTIKADFSVEDAKVAGLWLRDKQNLSEKKKLAPWYKYPRRMLKMRAREAYKDAVPGALIGITFAEIAQDLAPIDVTPPPEAEIAADEAPATKEKKAAESKTAPPADKPPAEPVIIYDVEDKFPWLQTFMDRIKFKELGSQAVQILKNFIMEACQKYAVSPEEVQSEALREFEPFHRQFNQELIKQQNAGTRDPSKKKAAQDLETEKKDKENFWLNRKAWVFAGGINFKTVVHDNLEDLKKMPLEFVEEIADRWYNKIRADLGDFPIPLPGIDKAHPVEISREIPDDLKKISERLLWFETNKPDETLKAREALNQHMEIENMPYEQCKELLVQILLHFQPEPDEPF